MVEVDLALEAAFDQRRGRQRRGVPEAPMTIASGLAAINFSTCPVTLVSLGANRSLATIGMPFATAALSTSAKNASPSASLKPMYPSVLTPFAEACSRIAPAIITSVCGVLNDHAFLASTGSMMRIDDASEIAGVSRFGKHVDHRQGVGCRRRADDGVDLTLANQLLGILHRSGRVGGVVEQDVLDRLPPAVFGHSATVFFSGIPSDAAGPVAETVTPTLTCAPAARPAQKHAAGKRTNTLSHGSSLDLLRMIAQAWRSRGALGSLMHNRSASADACGDESGASLSEIGGSRRACCWRGRVRARRCRTRFCVSRCSTSRHSIRSVQRRSLITGRGSDLRGSL